MPTKQIIVLLQLLFLYAKCTRFCCFSLPWICTRLTSSPTVYINIKTVLSYTHTLANNLLCDFSLRANFYSISSDLTPTHRIYSHTSNISFPGENYARIKFFRIYIFNFLLNPLLILFLIIRLLLPTFDTMTFHKIPPPLAHNIPTSFIIALFTFKNNKAIHFCVQSSDTTSKWIIGLQGIFIRIVPFFIPVVVDVVVTLVSIFRFNVCCLL